MLSYDFARMGGIMRNSDLESLEFIRILSDNPSPQARNYLSKVIFVEIDCSSPTRNIEVWPLYECGNYDTGANNRRVFTPDVKKSLVYPFTIPSGGNPLNAQGIYAIPSYPIYDAHFRDFVASPDKIKVFLEARMKRTIGLAGNELDLDDVSRRINKMLKSLPNLLSENGKGLMVLLFVGKDLSPYSYSGQRMAGEAEDVVGSSMIYPDCKVIADSRQILNRLWQSGLQEGRAGGCQDTASCSLCHTRGPVVSGYNKSLLWIPTTWEAPLPFGNDKRLVDSIALCKECYSNLTLGASVFASLSNLVDKSLLKEVFSPVASASVRNRQKKNDVGDIYGSMMALPLLDLTLDSQEGINEWARTLLDLMPDAGVSALERPQPLTVMHLDNLTGFTSAVPDIWMSEDWRLQLIYYSGEPAKLNIHIRAVIEDILPSTASRMVKLLKDIAYDIEEVMESYTSLGDASLLYKLKKVRSLPYLLSTAFGAPYLWSTMEKMFKCLPIDERLFYRNIALRMNQEAKKLPGEIYNLQLESVNYVAIRELIAGYNHSIAKKGGMELKPVQELIKQVWETPIEELGFTTVDELAFAAGQIVQRFGRIYYEKNNKKDFIQHRVLTFGRSLTPEAIRTKAIGRMEEYDKMLNLKVSTDILQRAAVISMGFIQLEDEVKRERDRFMSAFWAGYSLGRKKKEDKKDNQEVGANDGK